MNARSVGCFPCAHTGVEMPPSLHGEVKFQLLVELILYAAAKQQGADAQLTVAPSHTGETGPLGVECLHQFTAFGVGRQQQKMAAVSVTISGYRILRVRQSARRT